MAVQSYKELIAWQKAMDLAVEVYRLTQHFPREEIYGLTSQLRRAAVSVPSNIAEGQGRGAPTDFARYLRMAIGSLHEAETQLILAERLGYAPQESVARLLESSNELGRIARGLERSLAT